MLAGLIVAVLAWVISRLLRWGVRRALRDILENLIAGVLIQFTRPFTIGDQIVSGDAEGTVTDIQFRATVVRTYDNRAVVIPNSELYTNRVVVNTRHESVRHQVDITVPNTYSLEPIREAILEVLYGEERVLDAPSSEAFVTALFERFGAMGLENIRPESIQYNAGELPEPAEIRPI